jgi:hypothetical protein
MTVDFSDFDRRIKDLTEGLDASKSRPFQEEASKKLEAFLKENEQFFAEHKQNPHVKEQLNNLAGRIQSAFPEDSRATYWASPSALLIRQQNENHGNWQLLWSSLFFKRIDWGCPKRKNDS